MWGGRFTKDTDEQVDDFHSSIGFDYRLLPYDIQGSKAHARMLAHCGIIQDHEAELICSGLDQVHEEIVQGRAELSTASEDIHMNVERLLIERVGDVGRKLHTARSRNDQVALDTRLYLKDALRRIEDALIAVEAALIELAEQDPSIAMPGYTHLQRAQPVLLAHHLLAYVEMFERDRERFGDCYKRVDVCPLGSGAIAGTTFPIDREFVRRELGFAKLSQNSMDAVSDRDFALEFLGAAAIVGVHMSRLSEEIVLWATSEFGFVELDDAYSTGSSMMPQKKNPDVPELVRGKTGRLFGNLIGLLTTMKGLPLAYNKDMQEDKEALFDSVDTLERSLLILAPTVRTLRIRKDRMAEALRGGYLNATDLADYLTRRGVPFRKAHELVGKAVWHCAERGLALEDLSVQDFRHLGLDVAEDLESALSVQGMLKTRNCVGGTALERVLEQLAAAKEAIATRRVPPPTSMQGERVIPGIENSS